MKHVILTLTMLLFATYALAQSDQSKSVIINSSTAASTTQTTNGPVCGYIYRGVYTYKGIPYAQAGRFEVPKVPTPWTKIRSCRTYGPSCPQPKSNRWDNDAGAFFYLWFETRQNEDCLRLNVWTKGIKDGKKRPVIVWFHGGGFVEGAGYDHPGYDGHNMADRENVVVVTVNHRLNTLGYTDLSDFGDKYKYSGNVGNIDLVAALKWVHDNISYFGGDPKNVTIFGQSGGGAKVSSMLCMPMAKGLFHKAMIMSGSGFMCGMDQTLARKIGRRTVELLGLTKDNIDEIQRIPYEKLYEANVKAMNEMANEGHPSPSGRMITWEPVIDGDALPLGLWSNGSEKINNDVPLIIGSTFNEFYGGNKPGKGVSTWEEAKTDLSKKMGKRADKFVDAFRKAYPKASIGDMYRLDVSVRPAALMQCNKRIADGGAPVWNYLFVYHLPSEDGEFHAGHNADIAFYFNNVVRSANMTGATPEGIRLGETMCDALCNFARTGKPYAKGMPEWKPVTKNEVNTMVWDCPTIKLVTNHDEELVNLMR